ncbi:hypothetical protein B0H65DRAFT_551528 [Neurospora tetraspora]|uniref:Secreted protein n=1 Tax=Neurospora tetraspora TaxID=94610 RepID=A0AAE0MPH4_9PEZI|nr:hypothetical protein B0H65DRAFT_551528 [Neurospora tetraspora]
MTLWLILFAARNATDTEFLAIARNPLSPVATNDMELTKDGNQQQSARKEHQQETRTPCPWPADDDFENINTKTKQAIAVEVDVK